MKRFLTTTAILMTSATYAATSGVLLIKGTIPAILSININALPVAANLSLDVMQTNLKIATVVELSNSNTGYKVSIASSNLGVLKRVGGSESVPYSLSYDGVVVNLAAPQFIDSAAAVAVSQNKDVNISYTGVDLATKVAGDYADTVTFTISAL